MYGETLRACRRRCINSGLSPHVRGNQLKRTVRPGSRRSIPACTGKPGEGVPVLLAPQVYPRMYGETVSCRDKLNHDNGLSPHVRGNRAGTVDGAAVDGSIPACTGKPCSRCRRPRLMQVYPRMYGETPGRISSPHNGRGLSPHVRGNPGRRRTRRPHAGSIPACTGKPPPPASDPGESKVYPRMYGETEKTARSETKRQGLSPHVRGNPRPAAPYCEDTRSIPACTGKPKDQPLSDRADGVYPRMYGETRRPRGGDLPHPGLSPHVRGNRRSQLRGRDRGGSIPACTGKPTSPSSRTATDGVYPRMYGET